MHPHVPLRSWNGTYVFNGMTKDIKDGHPIYEPLMPITPSIHLTIVFNLFVFFSLWNLICSRKINDELNIFEGFFETTAFVLTWSLIVIGQVLLVTYGNAPFKCHVQGLTWQ